MSKNRVRSGIFVAAVVIGAIILTIGGIIFTIHANFTQQSRATAPTRTVTASVTIPQSQEVFAPFIVTVQPNTTVTWENKDTVTHTFGTTWDQNTFLNPEAFSLTVAAGHNATFTFTKPGLYEYFDKTDATWDETDHRVMAHKGVPNFPLAMEGIIWVQGSISGLPSSAANDIPNGKDQFLTEFLAITQGGTVSWHNEDTDAHIVAAVTGWPVPVNPTDLGVNQIEGTQGVPHGQTKVITFNKPGLYYYYCPAHASVNTTWHRVQANKDASEFPLPMEGFILVRGS